MDNLFLAWEEFLKGKRKRKDVQEFSEDLSKNIYDLHLELKNKIYAHGPYTAFNISDPKPRNIHKASVRDRLLHHAIYRVLYPHFDKRFISDSYSCRIGKGTHKAILRYEYFSRKVSENYTKQAWVLKCDIKKFFASIDHQTLSHILSKHIQDTDTLWLLNQVISSFSPGLPLGNLTSQLLVNIYMNEFDQFVKHQLKAKYYIRYADDFIIFSPSKPDLMAIYRYIEEFLNNRLRLTLHPNKVVIKTIYSGLDFLGWVHFPEYRVLRTTTKRRMMKRMRDNPTKETRASYLGMLGWGSSYKLKKQVRL